jgi:hypothetical protein
VLYNSSKLEKWNTIIDFVSIQRMKKTSAPVGSTLGTND